MAFAQPLARYESGAIAGHELAVETLNLLDPRDPSAVLLGFPPEIVPRLRDFLDEYRPGQMLSSQGGSIPSPDQVEAARAWLASAPIEKPHPAAV
jgi:hypothetical protein